MLFVGDFSIFLRVRFQVAFPELVHSQTSIYTWSSWFCCKTAVCYIFIFIFIFIYIYYIYLCIFIYILYVYLYILLSYIFISFLFSSLKANQWTIQLFGGSNFSWGLEATCFFVFLFLWPFLLPWEKQRSSGECMTDRCFQALLKNCLLGSFCSGP